MYGLQSLCFCSECQQPKGERHSGEKSAKADSFSLYGFWEGKKDRVSRTVNLLNSAMQQMRGELLMFSPEIVFSTLAYIGM